MNVAGRKRVAITGIGAITAAGSGSGGGSRGPSGSSPNGLWGGVCRGVPGAGRVTRFDPSPFRSQMAAEVTGFDAGDFMGRREARRLDRFAQFALAS